MRNRLNKLYHGLYVKLAGQIETYDTSNIMLIHDHIVCILERICNHFTEIIRGLLLRPSTVVSI